MAPIVVQTDAEMLQAATESGLRYVTDLTPGITRERKGDDLVYLLPDGRQVTDERTLERLRKLVLPPAWTRVWICPDPEGHLQATGYDKRGRKQYRYHNRWRHARDRTKYHRMIAFAEALPKLRLAVARDLQLPGLPRRKVLATVVRLLEETFIRVGNEEYARDNKSYGLTTLRDRHVEVQGGTVRFCFRGKSGKEHEVEVSDPHVARIVRECQDLPGQELFQYVDSDGARQKISSEDVNEYLRAIAGEDFTAKDFRTWAGTVLATLALCECGRCEEEKQAKQNVVETIKRVAGQLGNRPAVCRKYYIHPMVLDCYAAGTLEVELETCRQRANGQQDVGLFPEEEAVVGFLRKQAGGTTGNTKTRATAA